MRDDNSRLRSLWPVALADSRLRLLWRIALVAIVIEIAIVFLVVDDENQKTQVVGLATGVLSLAAAFFVMRSFAAARLEVETSRTHRKALTETDPDPTPRGLDLVGVDLSAARLARIDGRGANLSRARLAAADLRGADLSTAWLNDANLRGADLERAQLTEAVLRGADLRGARLDGTELTGATYDQFTEWPNGFDAKQHGARFDHTPGRPLHHGRPWFRSAAEP